MRLASLLESKRSQKLAGVLLRRGKPLGVVLYVCGLVYIGLLPRDEFNHRSFIDENALMTGLVHREFRDSQSISDHAQELASFHDDREGILDLLESSFIEMGLEVYSQNYTARRRAVLRHGDPASLSGRNVYGILRAGRASSAESLVFSCPTGEDGPNTHGLAVMLSLAEYFKSKSYWAKDIIFLVTTGQEIGVQAWINSYMGDTASGIDAGPLPGRSGAIQAVINLELDSPKIEYAGLLIEGVNGILPNLDLVHVLTHLSEMEGLPSALHVKWEGIRSSRSSWSTAADSTHKLFTVVSLLAHQAPGLPLSGHALFLRHRIDSVTVRGMGSGPKAKPLLNIARALEGSFRSLNNLLERLHHSEFFYYAPSRGRFISIGYFMPSLGFLLAPLIIEGLSQWLLARGFMAPGSSPTSQTSGSTESTVQKVVKTPQFPFHAVLSLILPSLMSGLLLLCLPHLTSVFLSPLTAGVLVAALAWGCLLSIFIPLFSSTTVPASSWHMTKCFSLIFQLLLIVTMAMINYALALSLLLFLPLPAVFSPPYKHTDRRLPHSLGKLSLLLFSPPLSVLYLCSLYHAVFVSPATLSLDFVGAALLGGVEMVGRGLVMSYNSWYTVEAWLFPVGCGVVWPIWLMGWRLACQTVTEETKEEERGVKEREGGGRKNQTSSSSSPSSSHSHSD